MTEAEFLKLAKAKYRKIQSLTKEPTLLDYEKGFEEIWQELGAEVAQLSLGDPGKDKRKKKSLNVL